MHVGVPDGQTAFGLFAHDQVPPSGYKQSPPLQLVPPGQVRPQPSQFRLSWRRSAHPPPQAVRITLALWRVGCGEPVGLFRIDGDDAESLAETPRL